MSHPTAKSLLLDVLSSQRGAEEGASMPVSALVAVAALFEVDGNAVRVALSRLLSSGSVLRDERGYYRLGRAARAVAARVGAFRTLSARLRPWRGDWVSVHRFGSVGRGKAARAEERALGLLGFRELAPGLSIRPDNLRGGVAHIRVQLQALGLRQERLVAALSDLDEDSELRARDLWDVYALARGYLETREQLAASRARLPQLSARERMVETFLIGGRALRQIAFDPLLPEPLVSERDRRALVQDLRAYDALGRSCWAPFLSDYGVVQVRGPVDLHAALAPELRAPSEEWVDVG